MLGSFAGLLVLPLAAGGWLYWRTEGDALVFLLVGLDGGRR